jgi:PAS domain S-box-containing protein
MKKKADKGLKVIPVEEKVGDEEAFLITKEEKSKRKAELIVVKIAKAKRAAELVIANAEKAKHAAAILIAHFDKEKHEVNSIDTDKELAKQYEEGIGLAAEMVISDIHKTRLEAESTIANIDKAKRSAELISKKQHPCIQKDDKNLCATELIVSVAKQSKDESDLVIENIKKAKHAAGLVIANLEKTKRSAELVIANKELVYEKIEKARHATGLLIENVEKAKKAAKYVIANIEKAKKAAQLIVINKELLLVKEKEKLTAQLIITNKELKHQIDLRKESDRKLKESNEKYSEAYKSSQYSITITRIKDGKFLEVNDAFTSIFGFSREDATSSSSIDLGIWANIKDRQWVISNLGENKPVSEKEFLFRKKNGELITCMFSARSIKIENESCIISSFDNITERKQVEKALLESNQKFHSYIEHSPLGLFVVDKAGKYVDCNNSACKMVGYTRGELLSMGIMDLLPVQEYEKGMQGFQKLLDEGSSKFGIIMLRKDKSTFHTQLEAVQLPQNNLFMAFCTDIEHIKNAEFELEKKLEEIESINKELIGMNMKLTKAKERAEESDRLKSSFLTNMSHEIRTPMNGILGFAELLKEPNLTSDEFQEYIQTIQISGARMLYTINSIVDMAKIESGLMLIDIVDTDINKTNELIYRFFTKEAAHKGLHFSYKNSLPSNRATIQTDNEKINAILTNLVRNAIKFTQEGSIKFGYKKKGDTLEYFVRDTGVGIPVKQQKIIFERFRQGSESHNRGYEGSGLGLAISKSYVEMLGGNLWVESQEGLGATFFFTIPYIPASKVTMEVKEPVTGKGEEIIRKHLKILIVEDDEISYTLLARALQKMGLDALHVTTGAEAVELIRTNPEFDLVLMDIRMPMMNGLEATKQIRQFNKEVIIIAQTAFGFTSDHEAALEAGCNDYISKPIRVSLLSELIKKHETK